MDLRIKQCSTGFIKRDVGSHNDSPMLDRLTSLPNDVLGQVLCLLPTKDAAVASLCCKKMRVIFLSITTLDLNDSSILYCLSNPSGVERFPNYVIFVDTVLQQYQSPHLTRFKLQVGGDPLSQSRQSGSCFFTNTTYPGNFTHLSTYGRGCFPDLNSMQLYRWMSFPLGRHGLTQLDLCIHVREPGEVQLPSGIFMCETLEVLMLDLNLHLDRVSTFHLPNLKLLHLKVSLILEDGFVTRLVSSCPLLEDLSMVAYFNHLYFTNICSSSLRRLKYHATYDPDECDNPDVMLINTPNLEYLDYEDNLASHYTISNMDSLVKAKIIMVYLLEYEERKVSFQQLLNIIRSLSNAQHLELQFACTEGLNFVELKDELPVFRNLTYLELDQLFCFWDQILLGFLNRSPVLETLVFPRGFDSIFSEISDNDRESLELEREFCRRDLATIPWCCRVNLKKIVVKEVRGTEREINLIQFLLKHALVLEELVIFVTKSLHQGGSRGGSGEISAMSLESTLQTLSRASVTCSIQVQ